MGKTISGSVGKGGKNRPEDVIVVQYLLNCVPAKQGGPGTELALDGICGPLTCGAILGFQSAVLGFADSRVDAGGKTLSALLGYDPYPNQKLNLPASGNGIKGGKRGGTPSTNSWDPWGYNNPAGENYQKDGKQPGAKFGGDSSGAHGGSIKNSGGGKQSGAGDSDGFPPSGMKGGTKSYGGKWGGKAPFGGNEDNQMAGGKWDGAGKSDGFLPSGIKGGTKGYTGKWAGKDPFGGNEGNQMAGGKWGGNTHSGIKGGAGIKTGGPGATAMPGKDGGIVGKF